MKGIIRKLRQQMSVDRAEVDFGALCQMNDRIDTQKLADRVRDLERLVIQLERRIDQVERSAK